MAPKLPSPKKQPCEGCLSSGAAGCHTAGDRERDSGLMPSHPPPPRGFFPFFFFFQCVCTNYRLIVIPQRACQASLTQDTTSHLSLLFKDSSPNQLMQPEGFTLPSFPLRFAVWKIINLLQLLGHPVSPPAPLKRRGCVLVPCTGPRWVLLPPPHKDAFPSCRPFA